MTKKSFKGANPAMQFINAAIEETVPEPIVTPPVRTVQAPVAPAAPKVVKEPPVEVNEPATPVAAIASSPAAATPTIITEAVVIPAANVTREAAPVRQTTAAERKSKRLNLLIQPSIMEDLQKVSHMKQKSVNDLINIVLREYCGNKRELIEKYDMIFGE